MTPIVGLMPARIGPGLRAALCLGLLGLLAACGTGYHNAAYDTHRRGDYAPPGPPEDPWGPYIREASQKYRVPEQWVRAVMRQESGGREYLNGHPITSNAGAMGLMQVMPSTYASLADRYGLGGDPYEPHDNIMAGTAYIREMYEQFGSPGFLAVYNAGPGRLSNHLATGKPLPGETVQYVAAIAPRLGDDVAPSGEFAAYAAADHGPRSARQPARVMMASAAPRNPNGDGRSLAQEAAWQTAGQHPEVELAMAAPPSRSPAEEAAWQTSPAQYGGSAGAGADADADAAPSPAPVVIASAEPPPPPPPGPPPAPRPAPVVIASAEPAPSSFAATPLPPPVPYGSTPRLMTAVAAAPPANPFRMASAQAGEMPPAFRYAPVSRPASAPELPMPPPPPGPGLLGTIPVSRHGTPEPPMSPRLQLASASAGAARVFGGSGGNWTIQVGAYATPALARSMAENAEQLAGGALHGARPTIGAVTTASGGTLYRARLTGLSSASASAACSRLAAGHMSCVTVPPDERW